MNGKLILQIADDDDIPTKRVKRRAFEQRPECRVSNSEKATPLYMKLRRGREITWIFDSRNLMADVKNESGQTLPGKVTSRVTFSEV